MGIYGEYMFDSKLAGEAIVDGLVYLQGRLKWSRLKIARVLHYLDDACRKGA